MVRVSDDKPHLKPVSDSTVLPVKLEAGEVDGIVEEDYLINVSVPIKMIWAAFQSDKGEVTSPKYGIINRSRFPVNVGVTGLDTVDAEDDENYVELVKPFGNAKPGENELALMLRGGIGDKEPETDWLPFENGLFETGWLAGEENPPIRLGRLDPMGEICSKLWFYITGMYGGDLSHVRKPHYRMSFIFSVAEDSDQNP